MNSRFKKFSLVLFLPVIALLVLTGCEETTKIGIFGKQRMESVAGQDGCSPVKIGKGIMMWTFGDTILGYWTPEVSENTTFEQSGTMTGMISNSVAFSEIPDDENVENLNFTYLKDNGVVKAFISPDESESAQGIFFWAMGGIKLHQKVYVSYTMIQYDPVLWFKIHGSGLAVWEKPADWKVGDEVNFTKLGVIFKSDEPAFGDYFMEHNGYVYVLGRRAAKDFKVPMCIARVKPEKISDRSSYEFLMADGSWTTDVNNAENFFNDVSGEPSITYNEYIKRFVIVYCSLDGNIKLVHFKKFSELASSEVKNVYTPDKLPVISTRPFIFYYSGKEIFHTREAIYAVYMNPAIYQPILIKIPYWKLLDEEALKELGIE